MDKNLSLLNESNLKSGKLINLIPEFYELKNTVENSEDGWHVKESVFNHTLSVMSALKKLIKNKKNLDRNILTLAALLHDIGKKEALIKNGEFTSCRGHESISVGKSKIILKRFDLTEEEIKKVLKIITNHSVFHKLLMPDNSNFKKEYSSIKENLKDIFPELILLSYADTINSKLKNIDPAEFKHRIDFYKKETEKI